MCVDVDEKETFIGTFASFLLEENPSILLAIFEKMPKKKQKH